jgi:hypothetical protein
MKGWPRSFHDVLDEILRDMLARATSRSKIDIRDVLEVVFLAIHRIGSSVAKTLFETESREYFSRFAGPLGERLGSDFNSRTGSLFRKAQWPLSSSLAPTNSIQERRRLSPLMLDR